MAIKSLSIRIDDEMLKKLHQVADYEGRSANSQILVLIRRCIEEFEAQHGALEQYTEMVGLMSKEHILALSET